MNRPRSVVDMGGIFHAFWSNLLSALIVYLVLSMFSKAESYEIMTTDQKERLIHKCSAIGKFTVAVFNVFVWLFV